MDLHESLHRWDQEVAKMRERCRHLDRDIIQANMRLKKTKAGKEITSPVPGDVVAKQREKRARMSLQSVRFKSP